MSKVFKPEEIIGKTETRSIALLTREITIDEENRTVELSFSSDTPIRHWFGYLILDHSASSVRLERINASGALLWMHDRRTQIGSVSSVRVDDGKGRALAKFSRGTLGEEKFQDVKDEICRTTSFGFCIYQLDAEVGQDGKQAYIDGEPVYRSRDWEPFEVSLEPIPADITTGVNRSLEGGKPEEISSKILDKKLARGAGIKTKTEKKMEEEEIDVQTGEQSRTANPPASNAPAAAVDPVVARVATFRQFGAEFGEVELARDMALVSTNTIEDLGKAILEKRAANQPKVPAANPQQIAERQGGNIHLARSIPRNTLQSFKGANAQEDAYRTAQFLLAALFRDDQAQKYCRDHGIALQRDQTGGRNELGGVFVPVEMESAIIDLRIEYGVARRTFDVTPMTSDTKVINRRTGGLTAVPVGAGKRGTKSDATWDQIELVARKWMVLSKYEDELSEDSLISMADTLVSEIAYAFTKSEDDAGFMGDGTSQFHGIVGLVNKLRNPANASSLPAVANVAGLVEASGNQWDEITEADILKVVGRLPQFARRSGQLSWFCSNMFWATVLERIALAKGGVTYAEINGKLSEVFMGIPVEIVEVMPSVEANSQIPLLYGNAKQAATMGDRRGVTVKMTDSNGTDFESDLQTIKGTERFDINVHDVGNVDATPSKQKAGPIVGLITKAS